MYDLPKALIITNKILKKISSYGYKTLCTHPASGVTKWHPIVFTLVGDDKGIKYIGCEHAYHPISKIE